ncbi:MAG: polymer-forming cytoskeletal protein [Deltaproteobacteria bacterium]|nr:MAG: polymer-forming cytoskeletal protein [Deltaproteobacteria bacterium]
MDRGSSFEGKLSFKDTVRIDGSFRGEIESENTLIVGESGDVQATIRSQTVVVCGEVEGDVIAGRQVVVQKTGRLVGAIETPSLIVEEGAVLDGPVKMVRPTPPANGKVEPKNAGSDPAKAETKPAKTGAATA